MLFNSHVFIFVFLPIVLDVFRLLSKYVSLKIAVASLVISSLIFYGWWHPVYLWIIIGSILFNYTIGEWMGGCEKGHRKLLLVIGISGNLILLGYFKFYGFFVHGIPFYQSYLRGRGVTMEVSTGS